MDYCSQPNGPQGVMAARSAAGLGRSRGVTRGLSKGRSISGQDKKREARPSALSTTAVARIRAAVFVRGITALSRINARRVAFRCGPRIRRPAGRGTCKRIGTRSKTWSQSW